MQYEPYSNRMFLWLLFLGNLCSGISSDVVVKQSLSPSSDRKADRLQTVRGLPKEPETLCPEFCVCSHDENALNCNGDHYLPFPAEFPAYGYTSVLLQHFTKNDLHLTDMDLLTGNNSLVLQELRLPRNGMNVIKGNVFAGLISLKRLDLSANKLSRITNSTFIGLPSLLHLDLSSNRIAAIDAGSFAYLPHLIQLELSSNKLSLLTSDLFVGLHALQYLNLEVNQIMQLDPAAFMDIPQLIHLNLALNPLATLENVTFEQTHQLQYADFSHCNMRTIPSNLPSAIHDIRLSGNKLTHLDSEVLRRYTSLTILVLDDCNITSLHDFMFTGGPPLQRLWLNGNQLNKVPANLPPTLKALYLDENKIKTVKRTDMASLVELEELHLQRNYISEIENCSFCQMEHLHHLDLRGNRLVFLNHSLLPPINSLSTLDLSSNPLRRITAPFLSHMSALRQLDFSRVEMDNHLIMPTESVFPASLNSLDISGNKILAEWFFSQWTNIDTANSSFPHLHTINMRNCQVSVFPARLEPLFGRLSRIKIGQNPISCTALNEWLIKMIQARPEAFYKPSELKCNSPKYLRLQSLTSVPISLLQKSANFSEFKHLPTTKQKVGSMFSNERLIFWQSDSHVPLWLLIAVICFFVTLLLVLLLVYLCTYCTTGRLKLRQFSIKQRLCRLLHVHHDPFPQLVGSTRTLYSTSGDSVYTITSELPSTTAPITNEPQYAGFDNIPIRDDDGSSASSAFHTYREYRV